MLRSNEMTVMVMNEEHFLLFYNDGISKRLFTILPKLYKICNRLHYNFRAKITNFNY